MNNIMAKKLTTVVLLSIMLAGCAQFAEMDEARDTGVTYLTGRFEEQICELEAFATAHPELGYSTEQIVKEVIPPKNTDEVAWEIRTKYETPNAKIRLYGKKVKVPASREGINAWICTTDENIANLKKKFEAKLDDLQRQGDVGQADLKNAAEGNVKRQEEERV